MPNAIYTTQPITAQTKRKAYQLLGSLCEHLPSLGVDLVSVVRNGDNTVTITLTGALSAEQRDHLGLP